MSGHYRWNVNPTWEHYCGMVREVNEAIDAKSTVHRQHHMRAALYFGIGSIEAFLNEQMRGKLQGENVPEESIFATLRKTAWTQKLKDWPKELTASNDAIPAALLASVRELSDLRG